MRIASLVPSATELLFALGLGDRVVAVTHECDYPPAARELPHLTASVIPPGLTAAEIHAAVRQWTDAGLAIYTLDEPLLAELGVGLIATQAVCEVCAVSFDDVVAAAARLPSRPRVISLDPDDLGDALADFERLAEAAGEPARGAELRADGERRIAAVADAVADAPRPRVAAIEWVDPLYLGGHWVPTMIDLAGGVDVLGSSGARSRPTDWTELEAAAPEVVVSMPCGYGTGRAVAETVSVADRLAPLGARVVAVDASSYFSRPGPRLVDGVELLGHVLHPDRVPAPPSGRFAEVSLQRS